MKNPKHLIKKMYFLSKNYKKLIIGSNVSFNGGMEIKIIDKGRISIGNKATFRGNDYLRCLNNGVLSIGENCFFNINVSITSMNSISIGNNCKIANNVVIVDHDHDYNNDLVGYTTESISIGDNVWIGANCVILKGVTIGKNSVVAAGSIVNMDIPESTVFFNIKENKTKAMLGDSCE